jgi:hypothetical protein
MGIIQWIRDCEKASKHAMLEEQMELMERKRESNSILFWQKNNSTN